MTGNAVDEYLHKLLFSNYSGAYPDEERLLTLPPKSHTEPLSFWNYKIKMDIKETGCSPYTIPFNKEVLDARKAHEKDNETPYADYMLPDGKTIMTIEQGNTEAKIYDYLEYLYLDYYQLNSKVMPFERGFLNEPLAKGATMARGRAEAYKSQLNLNKSLHEKVLQVMNNYCDAEKIEKSNIEKILLTGGCIQLKTNDGKKKLRKRIANSIKDAV